MDKYCISIQAFESIIKNLVRLEEERDILFEQFFVKPTNERAEMAQLLERYIKTICQLLINADKNITLDRKLPFITIGCEIEVEDVSTQMRNKFRLVSPLEEDIEYGDVSFLSPLGKALLLKKAGNIVDLDMPTSKVKYKIISINAIL